MRFKTLLIDPPWRFESYSDHGKDRSPEKHYPVMKLDDLKALSINDLMDDDSVCFMWATYPLLPQALELGAAWNLKFKTVAFTWAKMTKKTAGSFAVLSDPHNWFFGLGYWTRQNPEICLLFTKGSPKRKSASVPNLIVAPVRKHSQKPDEQYERIEKLVSGPYVELFARQRRAGWTSAGNEIAGLDIREELALMQIV